MGGCRCSYRTCRSATKLSGELHFFHYPVKHKDRCEQWIINAQKPEFFNLPDDQLRNKVVCDLHFEARYFTNVQRKRLVHDAVPTLNVGCEDTQSSDSTSNEYKDVQVLPANADGTIFTVDTDSMQHRAVTEPISTYSFRNGTLVPVYTEDSDETEHVVYTIAEDDIKEITNFNEGNDEDNYLYIDHNQEESNDNYEIVFNGNSIRSSPANKKSLPIVVENQGKHKPEETMEVVYITEQREDSVLDNKISVKKEPEAETSRSSQLHRHAVPGKVKETTTSTGKTLSSKHHVKKKFIRQIKLHSKEIASIKRTLNVGLKKPSKINVISALRGRVPPTLLGALTLNFSKKITNFTHEEFEFLSTVYDTSPDLYNVLIEKLNWNLPDPSVVQSLIKSIENE